MSAATSARRRPWASVLLLGLFVTIIVAVLTGLGVWQLERKAEKEALLAALDAKLSAPPMPLPPREAWPRLDKAANEYRTVTFPAEFLHEQEARVYGAASAFRPDVSGPGYWIFTPARLLGGSVVIVNRGFVPDGLQEPKSREQGQVRGVVEMTGALRWPETRGEFAPKDDPDHNLWYTRDLESMAKAKGWGTIAPFYVELATPVPPGGFPKPGVLKPTLPNNHLQYAITWFGLALVFALAFFAWARSRLRRPRPEARQERREPGF
jgi:cytochrome oxidase assembly protein ShyY1